MAAKKKILNSKGQALFEFIVFLPLLLTLVTMMITTGNAINASINQQKATRGYFFNTIQNNSRIPTVRDLDLMFNNSLTQVSAFAFGWREEEEGQNSSGACNRYTTIFGDITSGETCKEPVLEDNKSQFIRVFTFFGVCTETWAMNVVDSESNAFRANWQGKQSDICVLR